MRKSNMGNAVSLLSGLILGGLIGAVVALLMAPQSGDQVRALIRDRSNEFRDRAMIEVEDSRSRAGSAVRSVKGRVNDLIRRS